MGVQQLTLIVLTVIIIGISISAGIIMFNQTLIRNNRLAIIDDMNIFAGVAMTYYKTPVDMGGGNRTWNVDDMGPWFGYNYDAANDSMSNSNGTFVLSSDGDVLTIVGSGNEIGTNGSTNVEVVLTLTGDTSEIITTVNN